MFCRFELSRTDEILISVDALYMLGATNKEWCTCERHVLSRVLFT